jgi:hypothetical protein
MLIAAFLFGGLAISSAQAHPSTFTDVSETNPAHAAIEALAAQGVIAGEADGSFLPNTPVSRGLAALTIVRWQKVEPLTTFSAFSDVDPTTYGPYVAAALADGWMNGYPDGTFRPGQSLTRQQMITVIVRSQGLEASALALSQAQITATLGPFVDDSQVSDSARPYVALAVQRKMVSGDNGYLRPFSPVTRAQLCLVLYRASNASAQDVAESSSDMSPAEEALAAFMDTYLFEPHHSPITGAMVMQNQHWYGIPALSQLVVMAAETSLGDPTLGGALARNHNFGCLRYHGVGTSWGLLSSGRIWVAGKDWYAFPDAATGMSAFGRYLKTGANGFYLPIMTAADPDWEKFAAVYYGRGVSGFSSYVSRLKAIQNRFREMAAEHGLSL